MNFHQVARNRSIQNLLLGLEAQFGRDVPIAAVLAQRGPVTHQRLAQNLWEGAYTSCRQRGLPLWTSLKVADEAAYEEGLYCWRPDLRARDFDYL